MSKLFLSSRTSRNIIDLIKQFSVIKLMLFRFNYSQTGYPTYYTYAILFSTGVTVESVHYFNHTIFIQDVNLILSHILGDLEGQECH